jgi:AefR-like transcriptional repressor, C-terminal domain
MARTPARPRAGRALQRSPLVGVLIRAVLERLTDRFVREIYGTDRRKLIRLVMTEGPRFPQLAEFHYHHVVKGALRRMRARISVARFSISKIDQIAARERHIFG